MTSDLTVSIVICTQFRPVKLGNCLFSIAALRRQPDEVIVIDNTSGDQQTEDLARAYHARYLVEPTPGLSRARNRGLSESKSQIVAYLDDDTTVQKDWLEHVVDAFSEARVAVVTGRVILSNQDDSVTRMTSSFCLDKDAPWWFEISAFGGLGAGCNMAFRKSACNLPKMFDERLGRGAPYRGMEEHFAFAQLLSNGHKAVYLSTAAVYHFSDNPLVISRDTRNAFAYIFLLSSEFPMNRKDLLRFLIRRFRRKPISWSRDAPDPGELVRSGPFNLLKGSISGAMLYLRNRKVN